MWRGTEESLLKELLINRTILNIKNSIVMLKEIFITACNKQYLEFWFNFFELDFFTKDLKNQEKKYQWIQNILTKYQDIMMTNECKEAEFLVFKVEKEIFFPWDEEIEFKLIELTLAHEEQQQQAKSKVMAQIEAIKIELYCELSNIKLELKEKLSKNNQKQINILTFYNNSLHKLEIFQKQKTSKFFKFKSKIVIFFTCGYYNFAAKLINKIECEKVILQNQKQQLAKIGLKICNIKKSLNKIEKKIRKKRQLLACFKEEFSVASNEINSINIENNEVVAANNKLIRQL